MQTGKSPGLDNFTIDFFHRCRRTIHEEVWHLVEYSHLSHVILPTLNSNSLTLIPKEEGTTLTKQFRPIALCNVIYKLINKVMVNRLKPILHFIISKEKSGYVEGHGILDSIILAHEFIHSLKSSYSRGMIIKLDIFKAFDKLT